MLESTFTTVTVHILLCLKRNSSEGVIIEKGVIILQEIFISIVLRTTF